MRFEITEIEDLSGSETHIYTVRIEGETYTLLEQFFEENKMYEEDLTKILDKMMVMANQTGCKRDFFKEGEGVWADGGVALAAGKLRLYGMYFNNMVVLFGAGGYKDVRAYQDDPHLNARAEQMKRIASEINKAIRERTIRVNDDGTLNTEDFEQYD